MMADGLKTAFIHRSIQEFFAAFFVKHLGAENQVKRIYERIATNNILNWQQELRFLEEIDRYRYIEYFRLPAIKKFLTECSYQSGKVAVTKSNFLAYLSKQPIVTVPRSSNSPKPQHWIVGVTSDSNFSIFTIDLCKLFNHDGYVDDASILPSVTLKKPAQRIDKLFAGSTQEAKTALTKFREFAKKIEREQKRHEKTIQERRANFLDLLLPADS